MEIQWILLRNIVKSIDVMEPTIDEQSLEAELDIFENKPEGKILFYRVSKKWHGFLSALYKEDREPLLKMILEYVVPMQLVDYIMSKSGGVILTIALLSKFSPSLISLSIVSDV